MEEDIWQYVNIAVLSLPHLPDTWMTRARCRCVWLFPETYRRHPLGVILSVSVTPECSCRLENVTRPSIQKVVGIKWVKYPFKRKAGASIKSQRTPRACSVKAASTQPWPLHSASACFKVKLLACKAVCTGSPSVAHVFRLAVKPISDYLLFLTAGQRAEANGETLCWSLSWATALSANIKYTHLRNAPSTTQTTTIRRLVHPPLSFFFFFFIIILFFFFFCLSGSISSCAHSSSGWIHH